MKIKAYQVATEYQAGYMLEYMCDDTIIIAGNNYFIGHETDTYSIVRNALCNGENPCEEDEESFTVWEKLINDSTEQIISDEEAICEGLKLVTGEEWNYRELRGCSQGDWNGCYYAVSAWTLDALNVLEMEYFNIGAEWRLEDEDGEDWGNIYTHFWTDEENRTEIAKFIGVDPEDVTLYLFDGWTKTAKYKEV